MKGLPCLQFMRARAVRASLVSALTACALPLAAAVSPLPAGDQPPALWAPAPALLAPLPSGINLASSEAAPSMSPLFNPLLALYSRLMAESQAAGDAYQLNRLQAWLGGGRASTSLLGVTDVLSLELDATDLFLVDAPRLQGLGVAADTVASLTAAPQLTESIKGALMDLPAALADVPDPMALAVWSQEQGEPRVVALVLLK